MDSDSGSRASAAAKRLADKKRKTANSAGSSSASGAASAPSTPAAGQRVQFRTVPLDGEEEVVATPPKGKKSAKLATLMGTKPKSGAKKEVVKIGAAIETAEVRARVRVMHAPS